MIHKRAFGELELAVLRVLKNGQKMTVAEVHKALGSHDKYTTIMTVMNRLHEKGQLSRERVGQPYYYWLISQMDKAPSFISQLKNRVFGLKTTALMSYLLESADDLSENDLLELQEMIEKARKKL